MLQRGNLRTVLAFGIYVDVIETSTSFMNARLWCTFRTPFMRPLKSQTHTQAATHQFTGYPRTYSRNRYTHSSPHLRNKSENSSNSLKGHPTLLLRSKMGSQTGEPHREDTRPVLFLYAENALSIGYSVTAQLTCILVT